MNMNRKSILLAAACLAWQANAQTTTMQVPQGSGNYPTMGQIDCLEQEGSGRYCSATWRCADGSSGYLWDNMANHNGRRAIVADHPVANRLACVVEVDGKAAARWFHGYRPEGRDGGIVGMANAVGALRPVQAPPERTVVVGEQGSMLEFILERNDTTLRDIAERLVEDYRERGYCLVDGDLDSCLNRVGGPASSVGFGELMFRWHSKRATAWRQCMVEVLEEDFCSVWNRDGGNLFLSSACKSDTENGGSGRSVGHFGEYQLPRWWHRVGVKPRRRCIR